MHVFNYKRLFCALFTIVFPVLSFAQDLTSSEKHAIRAFVNDLKYQRKELVASCISYPLFRQYPLPPIKSASEFIDHYTEFIDDSFIESVNNGVFSRSGWRGIMCHYDSVSILSGDIDENGEFVVWWIGLTDVGKMVWQKCVEEQRSKLFPSLQKYSMPVLMFETIKFTIRIDQMSDGTYRYACWAGKNSISAKPDLILFGKRIEDGGNLPMEHYEFENKGYKYLVSRFETDDFDYELSVSKDGVTLFSQYGSTVYE